MTATMTRWRIPLHPSLDQDDARFYSSGAPNLERHQWASLEALKRANAAAGQVFFSRDTLTWFGSVNLHLVAGALVELQRKAPSDDLRYRVTWFDSGGLVIASAGVPSRSYAHDLAWQVHHHGFIPVTDDEA